MSGEATVINLLILILLATAFASAAGYVEVCSRLVGQRSPASDNDGLQLQFRNMGDSSRTREYGIELNAQETQACQLSALISGSRDVQLTYGGWASNSIYRQKTGLARYDGLYDADS